MSRNEIERKLIKMYEAKGFGVCDICRKCRDDVINTGKDPLWFPMGAFLAGSKMGNQKIKLLIVGKAARGDLGSASEYGYGLKCGRDLYNGNNAWKSSSWAFWGYTRQIVEMVFGNSCVENIAITNIIQCNNSLNVDTTRYSTKQHCIEELGAIKEEIRIVNPNTIVFYTAVGYYEFTRFAFDEFTEKVSTRISIGKKEMLWQEGAGIIDGAFINTLCTGHPERMNKREYTNAVVEWIKRVNSCDIDIP